MSDQPLRWGILGTGGTGRFLPGRRQRRPSRDRRSRDSERARAAAAEFGAERAGSYDDVFDAADVDVIYNALPNALHVEPTLRAAAAGKHCLCEKPLAPTVEGCQRMVAAAERHRRRAGRGVHGHRYHPRWARVRQLLERGRIGEVRLRASFGFARKPDRAAETRLSPAPAAARPRTSAATPSTRFAGCSAS